MAKTAILPKAFPHVSEGEHAWIKVQTSQHPPSLHVMSMEALCPLESPPPRRSARAHYPPAASPTRETVPLEGSPTRRPKDALVT